MCKNYSLILSNHCCFLFTHNEDKAEMRKICHHDTHHFVAWSIEKHTESTNTDLAAMINTCMTSRLDYCISLYPRMKNIYCRKLPLLLKAAASLLSNASHYERIALACWPLRKLPRDFRVQVKVIATVFKTLCGNGLRYWRDCCPLCSNDLLWQLCSSGTMKLSAKGRGSAMQRT